MLLHMWNSSAFLLNVKYVWKLIKVSFYFCHCYIFPITGQIFWYFNISLIRLKWNSDGHKIVHATCFILSVGTFFRYIQVWIHIVFFDKHTFLTPCCFYYLKYITVAFLVKLWCCVRQNMVSLSGRLRLKRASDYAYLNQSDCLEMLNTDDAQKFHMLVVM